MASKSWISFSSICAVLLAAPLVAQQRPRGRVINVPFERGVYYETPSGVVTLSTAVFLPIVNGGLKELLSVGSRDVVSQMPGAAAAVSISNTRPTFYMRGYRAGTQLYLVRAAGKEDYRELRMSRSRQIAGWAQFRSQDLTNVEMEHLGDDLVAVKPSADLQPGQYVLISALEPRYRAIRLAHEFGVSRGTTP